MQLRLVQLEKHQKHKMSHKETQTPMTGEQQENSLREEDNKKNYGPKDPYSLLLTKAKPFREGRP